MNVEYIDALEIVGESIICITLPMCPGCENYPTYNLKQCPYCGQELIYPEGVTVDEDRV